MRSLAVLAAAAVLAIGLSARTTFAQTPPARTLQLVFHEDGTVSLSAQHVSVREILAEWARQCGCYVVNWDKLTGGTLQIPVAFEHQTQAKVLESLLRQAAGFVLTPKRPDAQMVSNFETIYILPTSSASAASAYVPPVAPPPVTMPPMPTMGAPEDEIPALSAQPPFNGPAPPQGPPQPTPTYSPTMPGMAPGTQVPRANTPSVLVPIVPISTPQPTAPTQPSPNAPATNVPPPMPVPIVPAPPQVP